MYLKLQYPDACVCLNKHLHVHQSLCRPLALRSRYYTQKMFYLDFGGSRRLQVDWKFKQIVTGFNPTSGYTATTGRQRGLLQELD